MNYAQCGDRTHDLRVQGRVAGIGRRLGQDIDSMRRLGILDTSEHNYRVAHPSRNVPTSQRDVPTSQSMGVGVTDALRMSMGVGVTDALRMSMGVGVTDALRMSMGVGVTDALRMSMGVGGH